MADRGRRRPDPRRRLSTLPGVTPRPRPRVVVTAAALAAVLAGASACRVQPGAAAFVGSDRISEATVSTYLTGGTPSTTTSEGQLTPRQQVVSTLVVSRLFRTYLGATGGIPSDRALASSRDAAFTLVTGQGAPDDATLVPAVERLGFARSFADVYVQQIELESVVIDRSKAANLADLGKAVTAKTGTVRISPRYGTWNAAQLSLASASATPSWLKLSPASGA